MAVNNAEEVGKLDLKEASKRQEYLSVLDRVVESAYTKYRNKYTQNSERIMWGRLISDCCKTAAKILNDVDLEEIKLRIEKLEKASVK
jgi:hypothetical protein